MIVHFLFNQKSMPTAIYPFILTSAGAAAAPHPAPPKVGLTAA
jgi:hypothetical protein